MATNFPSSLDSLSNPSAGDYQDIVPHSSQHANANDAIEALQTKVGINGSSDVTSLDYKVANLNPLTTKGDIIVRSATANSRLPIGTDGYIPFADSAEPLGIRWGTPTSGGTVTTASVVSANGFTGSVATATTTPAITIATSVTGLVKGNGTAISAATQGTDYYAPAGTDVAVSDGGTGVSTLTAYAPIFGGTTTTNPIQSGTVGSAGQVLTSNGAGALPTFQNASGNKIYLSSTQVITTGTGEKTLYTFTLPANTIGTNNCVQGRIIFSTINAPAGGNQQIRVKIGATILCNIGIANASNIITSRGEVLFSIFGNGTTSSQKNVMNANLVMDDVSTTIGGTVGTGTSTFDSTVDQTITITCFPTSSANCTSESIIVTKIV